MLVFDSYSYRKIMTIANCSSETALEILKDVMELEGLDSCSILRILTLLGIGAVSGATFFVIGCGIACKGTPERTTERYDFGTDAYLLTEMPRDYNNDGAGNDDLEEDLGEVGMTEKTECYCRLKRDAVMSPEQVWSQNT